MTKPLVWMATLLLCLLPALALGQQPVFEGRSESAEDEREAELPQAGIPAPGDAWEQEPPSDHEKELPVGDLPGHFELVPALVKGLRAQDSAVRARCAFLLGQIGSRRTIGAIRALLHDPSRAARYQAGIALCSLADGSGVPAAGAALASAAEWIRYYAVHALADAATDRARMILETQRTGQPTLITEQIDEVLRSWPQPSVPPSRAERRLGPYGSLHELFVDVAGVYVVQSDRHWHVGKYPQCVRCNETVTFLDPQYVDIYSTSAWLLWSMGLDARAASVLRQGIDANPSDPDAWFNFGFHYMLKHEYATAARALKRAVELGVSAIGHRQYCHALERSGHPELALKEWQALREAHPEDPIAPRQITRLKEVLGQD